MKYRLIQSINRQLIMEFDADDFLAAMEVRGFQLVKLNANPRQRAELQGQPIFSTLCGPMWDVTPSAMKIRRPTIS
jgi:hypothetical protein